MRCVGAVLPLTTGCGGTTAAGLLARGARPSARSSDRETPAGRGRTNELRAPARIRNTAGVVKQQPARPDALHQQAQQAFLSGFRRGDDATDLVGAVAPHHVDGFFTPDAAMLDLAVTALDLACPDGAEPLVYEGLRERYLPEVTLSGRVEHRNSQYALYAAACMRGGLQPDLLHDAGWWQSPLWTYALFATVIYGRAAAQRFDVPTTDIAQRIAASHRIEVPGITA